jgi:hypothetical protein
MMNDAGADQDPNGEKASAAMTPEERQERWKMRVDRLAKNLLSKMSRLVDDPFFTNPTATLIERQSVVASFEKTILEEVEELKNESFGVELLHAIGYVYTLRAKQYLGR